MAASAFARSFSIEATRPSAAEIATLAAFLPKGTAVYLTAVPTQSLDELAKGAAALRKAGLEPIAHIAARRLSSAAQLHDLLAGAAQRSRHATPSGHRRRCRSERALCRRAGGDPERPPARGRYRGDRHRRLSGRPSAHCRRPAGSLARREDRRRQGAGPAPAHRQPVLVFARGHPRLAQAAARLRHRNAGQSRHGRPDQPAGAVALRASAAASTLRCAG